MFLRPFALRSALLALVVLFARPLPPPQATFPARPASPAEHLLDVTNLTAAQGTDFGPTAAAYWTHSKVYRRGDRFDLTVEFTLAAGWNLEHVQMTVDIDGPPGYGHAYDDGACVLAYIPVPGGACTSGNGTISFKEFVGISPRLEITWQRPASTDVRVGLYKIFVDVAAAGMRQNPKDPITMDCVEDDCSFELQPLYVIFNPYPNSGDSHVTGLSEDELTYYAVGDRDYIYYGGPDAAPIGSTVTLRPTGADVFGTVMPWLDALGATSAHAAADEITVRASDYIPGTWPLGPGLKLKSGNVPGIIQEKAAGENLCGQCMVFGSLTTAFDRSAGLPSRMLTARPSYVTAAAAYWNFHVWSEIWLNQVTNNDWSAHDASKGFMMGWALAITPVNPAMRQAAVFQDRFTVTGSNSPRGWTTLETGARQEVTGDYTGGPLRPPAAAAGPPLVTVTVLDDQLDLGEPVVAQGNFANPGGAPLTGDILFSLSADELAGYQLKLDNGVYSATETVTIPAGGEISRTYTIPAASYLYNGRFVARALLQVGPDRYLGQDTAVVSGGLALALGGPTGFTPGLPVTVVMTVTNLLNTAVPAVQVNLHAPDYLAPGQTDFTLDLAANETVVLITTVTPPDNHADVLEAQAFAPTAGLAAATWPIGGQPAAATIYLPVILRP